MANNSFINLVSTSKSVGNYVRSPLLCEFLLTYAYNFASNTDSLITSLFLAESVVWFLLIKTLVLRLWYVWDIL